MLIAGKNSALIDIAALQQNRKAAGVGISCVIEQVSGQTMISSIGLQLFNQMSDNDIRIALQKVDSQKARIFSADEGSINWNYR